MQAKTKDKEVATYKTKSKDVDVCVLTVEFMYQNLKKAS